MIAITNKTVSKRGVYNCNVTSYCDLEGYINSMEEQLKKKDEKIMSLTKEVTAECLKRLY